MGNILSTSTTTATNVTALDAATHARLTMNAPAPPGRRSSRNVSSHRSEPLSLQDGKPEPTKWSQESVVVTLQRFFGWFSEVYRFGILLPSTHC